MFVMTQTFQIGVSSLKQVFGECILAVMLKWGCYTFTENASRMNIPLRTFSLESLRKIANSDLSWATVVSPAGPV